MRHTWVTFDCFGTLVDWNSGFFTLLEPLAGNRTRELMSAYHQAERRIEREKPHLLYKEVLTKGLLQAAQAIGMVLDASEASVLPSRWNSMPVFPDVEPALAGLRAEGCKLAVLTNCDEDLFARTQQGFHAPFDLVITAERVLDYKPSLTHFRNFSHVTGANASNWIHVACSYYHDIAPARELGLRRIWVDRDQTGEDPNGATRHVQNTATLQQLVRELL